MKEELKYNTIAGVRNVNDLGKTFSYTSFCRVFCNKWVFDFHLNIFPEYKIEKYHKDIVNISQGGDQS